jgi:hypothetical protein
MTVKTRSFDAASYLDTKNGGRPISLRRWKPATPSLCSMRLALWRGRAAWPSLSKRRA